MKRNETIYIRAVLAAITALCICFICLTRVQTPIQTCEPVLYAITTQETNTGLFEPVRQPEQHITTIHSEDIVVEHYPAFTYSKDFDAEDSFLLAKIAECEAGNQNIRTRELVILCVLNRVYSDDFPDTICDVIEEDGQFSPVASGKFYTTTPSKDSWEAVENVIKAEYDYSDGCLFFESFESDEIAERSWFGRCKTFLYKSGNTRFYK